MRAEGFSPAVREACQSAAGLKPSAYATKAAYAACLQKRVTPEVSTIEVATSRRVFRAREPRGAKAAALGSRAGLKPPR